jgi:hypothetical protein
VKDHRTVAIDGFLGPSHVSSVIGSRPYEAAARDFQRPVVIAGFEPLDVMQATLMVIRQLNEGRYEVENEYFRVVTRDGNRKAQALVAEVLELRETFEWRGLGEVPRAASAPQFSEAPSAQPTASCLVGHVHRKIPSDRAWSPPKARVRPTGPMAVSASELRGVHSIERKRLSNDLDEPFFEPSRCD